MSGVRRHVQTDLDLHAGFDLRPLCAGLVARGADLLHCTEVRPQTWLAVLEHDGGGETPDRPEASFRHLLDSVEALPPELRSHWERCDRRVFDVAFDGGSDPFCWQTPLSAEIVRRLAAAGGELGITLYAPDPDGATGANRDTEG